MTTLRDIWIVKGMNSTQVAVAAKCSTPTLYKLNRKGGEEDGIAFGTVKRVCDVLGITLDEFAALDVCPDADKYRKRPEKQEEKR